MSKVESVVVGTDFSECAECAFDALRAWSRSLGVKKVHVVAVVAPATWVSTASPAPEFTEALLDEAQARLEHLDLSLPEDIELTREARLGSPAQELAAAAHERSADLIVAGTHGRTGITRALLGSVTSALIRVVDVPVLVVPSRKAVPKGFTQVLAAIDLSPVSAAVLRHAGLMAEPSTDGALRVLSLFEHPLVEAGEDELLPHYTSKDEIEAMGQTHRAEVERVVAESDLKDLTVVVEVMSKAPPFRVILDVAEMINVDLIVLGTSGRNAWHRMIVGSTATRVLTEAQRPVLVVPHASETAVV